MKRGLLFLIRLYRMIFAPLAGPCCRFYPSCSNYAEEAIKQKGPKAGVKMAIKRLLRCHPFYPGGYDPVR